ncbi:hypothetical protein CLG94_09295 [Candidatus Methylomirabilis limnetica]|uniref:Uncharacterized protein n=1 Tax=Candidatus Methylomirabilis limnetica TaxID=2033718 RepID=A0A2T4TWH6_9BACT|nr:hypothetical protein CLG94_09295 [Candidatus Methylomirabilis limnetica]
MVYIHLSWLKEILKYLLKREETPALLSRHVVDDRASCHSARERDRDVKILIPATSKSTEVIVLLILKRHG